VLHLNRKTEYALLALAHLSQMKDDGLAKVSEIAERFSIPPMLLSKVLQELKAQGYVCSTKGRLGGYSMNCRPEEIPIMDFLQSFGESTRLVTCESTDGGVCNSIDDCVIQDPLAQLEHVIISSMQHVTLADAIGQTKANAA